METMQEIFSYYDTDNDGIINEVCFKQIINILGLPINNVENKQYDYNDLNNYIYNHSDKKNIKIKKNKIEEILNNHLSEHLNENDINIVINDLFENKNTNSVDLAKFSNYLNTIPTPKTPQ